MSFCASCGKEIPQNAKSCPDCEQGKGSTREQKVQRTNRMVAACFVTFIICIILSLLLDFLWSYPHPLPFLLNLIIIFIIPVCFVLAAIFGITSIKQARQLGIKSRRIAMARLVLVIIGVMFLLGCIALFALHD